ncbi:MAG: GNAT family N-acetyltransferase [Bryobacterales bacterium]|nr:GNAT family N-acetyltransferase [Bryobacterales bacterium]
MSASASLSGVEIRPATPADVPVILQLIRALAEYERLAEHVTATEEVLRHSLFGPRPSAEALLAFAPEASGDPGRPIGFALFFENFSTFLGRPGMYLEDLFVVPEFRGRGAGRALFERLAQIALDRGFSRLDWAVLDWNEPAIRFYQSLGAMPMADWTVNRLTGDTLRALAAGARNGNGS